MRIHTWTRQKNTRPTGYEFRRALTIEPDETGLGDFEYTNAKGSLSRYRSHGNAANLKPFTERDVNNILYLSKHCVYLSRFLFFNWPSNMHQSTVASESATGLKWTYAYYASHGWRIRGLRAREWDMIVEQRSWRKTIHVHGDRTLEETGVSLAQRDADTHGSIKLDTYSSLRALQKENTKKKEYFKRPFWRNCYELIRIRGQDDRAYNDPETFFHV